MEISQYSGYFRTVGFAPKFSDFSYVSGDWDGKLSSTTELGHPRCRWIVRVPDPERAGLQVSTWHLESDKVFVAEYFDGAWWIVASYQGCVFLLPDGETVLSIRENNDQGVEDEDDEDINNSFNMAFKMPLENSGWKGSFVPLHECGVIVRSSQI
jgi:hypothetical protein